MIHSYLLHKDSKCYKNFFLLWKETSYFTKFDQDFFNQDFKDPLINRGGSCTEEFLDESFTRNGLHNAIIAEDVDQAPILHVKKRLKHFK